ncbi:MAG: EAL and GGDEF domain-containing protein [Magnetococcales bacterium]|nr:EAL and GGDEF domain-containing protein [Magnetococcales bacterium]
MFNSILSRVKHQRRALQPVDADVKKTWDPTFPEPNGENLRSEFHAILDHSRLCPHFMPIVAVDREMVFGHEALIRGPDGSPFHMPTNLFSMASALERTRDLEMLCRKLSLESFAQQSSRSKLFLNVSPHCLLDPGYTRGTTTRLMHELGIDSSQVVIEITENVPISDYELIARAVDYYRVRGFEVAVDDLGAGHSGLRAWFELRPDYIKLDLCFLKDITTNPLNQDFVRSLIRMAHDTGCKVVAEGIETPEVMHLLRDLQVDYMQGFYIGKPLTTLKESTKHPWPATIAIVRPAVESGSSSGIPSRGATLAELVQWVKPIAPDVSCHDVIEIFRTKEGIRSIPVVADGKPRGMVFRNQFLGLFLSAYGHSLYDRKQISAVMDAINPTFEQDTPLEQVSQTLTSRRGELQEGDFIVTHHGQYKGVINLLDLLRRITQLQVLSARNTNPLTMLPGNGPIQETVEVCLQQKQSFAIAYCDLDNFKPYNDIYGFSKGDAVIRATATALMSPLDRGRDFLGHIGGDDFIMIIRSQDWEQKCRDSLAAFSSMVPGFYDEEDLAAGGIRAANRKGNPTFFGLISLSIGVAIPDCERCHSYFDVATLASQAKKEAKKQEGNSIFISRRRFVHPAEKLPNPTDSSGQCVTLMHEVSA